MNELATTIREQTTVQDAAPLAATVQLLCGASTHKLNFDAAHLVLCPSVAPPKTIGQYLYQLAKGAQDAAYSRACSSILAGEGSEGDDTGDVAFWLGEGDFTSPGKVVEALGFSGNGIQRTELDLTNELNSALESMSGRYSFRLSLGDSRVAFFLVGQIDGGWGGLVGVGIWT